MLLLLYVTKRMSRRDKSSKPAGERRSGSGKGVASTSETFEPRRSTRSSPNRTDGARAPGAPRAERQSRKDQRTSKPLSQMDSVSSGTPAASKQKRKVRTPGWFFILGAIGTWNGKRPFSQYPFTILSTLVSRLPSPPSPPFLVSILPTPPSQPFRQRHRDLSYSRQH